MPTQELCRRFFTEQEDGKWRCKCGKELIKKKGCGWTNLVHSDDNKYFKFWKKFRKNKKPSLATDKKRQKSGEKSVSQNSSQPGSNPSSLSRQNSISSRISEIVSKIVIWWQYECYLTQLLANFRISMDRGI